MISISDKATTVIGIICGGITALVWIVVIVREVIDGHREQVLMNLHRRGGVRINVFYNSKRKADTSKSLDAGN